MSDRTLHICALKAYTSFSLELDVTLPLSGVTAIFGPSGSGKTTLLNLVSGFERADKGRISFDQEAWHNDSSGDWVPPHKRGVGFLFQDTRLFPHLSVRKNLEYADQRSQETHIYNFEDIVAATGLKTLLDRNPSTLSGGERQRVALARTLLARPRLLLFDEPLAALDRSRKAELLPFLETLPSQFDIPTLYVSHDIDEVSRIADRVLILEEGRVQSFGRASAILTAYGLDAGRNPFEQASDLQGIVSTQDDELELTEIHIGEAQLWLPLNRHVSAGDKVHLKIPARDVAISVKPPDGLTIQNALPATLLDIQAVESSAFCEVTLNVAGQTLIARITRKSAHSLALQPGKTVYALIKSASFQR